MKTEDEVKIRRLRKKLRQIENLERLERTLTAEEQQKVAKKHEVRANLLEILSTVSEDGSTEMFQSTAIGGVSDGDTSVDTSQDDSLLYDNNDDPQQQQQQQQQADVSVTDEEKMKRLTESVSQTLGHDSNVSETKNPKTESETESKEEKQAQKVTRQPDAFKQLHRQWLTSRWSVEVFEGHNDLVTSVSVLGQWLLTGSRDTTVKLWDICEGREVRSLGGHSGPITSVILLRANQAPHIVSELSVQTDSSDFMIGLSASHDCSIKIWNLSTGVQLKSIYTYSPITKLTNGSLDNRCYLISGSAGGKVELWDVSRGVPTSSIRAHDDSITGLQISDDCVYSCSADGIVNVLQVRGGQLRVVFVSENVRLASGSAVSWRQLRCLAAANRRIYLGDGAMNVKVLDWLNGVVHKLTNHTTEFGSTDAVCAASDLDLLIASGYDLDNGLGFMNIRRLSDERYLCSLCDEKTTRIVDIQCVRRHPDQQSVTIVTAGMELCVWKQVAKGDDQSRASVYRAQFVPQFGRAARDSTSEWEEDDDDDVRDVVGDDLSDDVMADVSGVSAPFVQRAPPPEVSKSWTSWCSLL